MCKTIPPVTKMAAHLQGWWQAGDQAFNTLAFAEPSRSEQQTTRRLPLFSSGFSSFSSGVFFVCSLPLPPCSLPPLNQAGSGLVSALVPSMRVHHTHCLTEAAYFVYGLNHCQLSRFFPFSGARQAGSIFPTSVSSNLCAGDALRLGRQAASVQ